MIQEKRYSKLLAINHNQSNLGKKRKRIKKTKKKRKKKKNSSKSLLLIFFRIGQYKLTN